MIELKPYRSISASTAGRLDTRLAGDIHTYPKATWFPDSDSIKPLWGADIGYWGQKSHGLPCFWGIVGLIVTILILILTPPRLQLACICGVSVFCGGLSLLFYLTSQNNVGQFIGLPTVLVSSSSVQRGDTIEVVFHLSIKHDMLLDYTRIELMKRETVTRVITSGEYLSGYKSPTTDVHDQVVQSCAANAVRVKAGTTHEHRATLTMPRDAMHNFALRSTLSNFQIPDSRATDYTLIWLIRITCQCHDFSPISQTYPLLVMPEVNAYD